MNTAYLLIGSNMGDRENVLQRAVSEIRQRCGPVIKISSLYQTAAWGLEEQEDFLNGVLQIETIQDAQSLLKTILAIEETLGRKRFIRYGPRLIDIDILFFNNEIIRQESLTVPHPQLQNRRFVLVPLAEVAPDLLHPVYHKTVTQLLLKCADNLPVQKFQ